MLRLTRCSHFREAPSVNITPHRAKLVLQKLKNMFKMTIVQLGVVVFAICLSTQVVSQNSTNSTAGENSNVSATTMPTDTYSSSANSTSPTGAGVSLHAGTFSVLIPVIMAASLLQRSC